jgi:hypothetical protein
MESIHQSIAKYESVVGSDMYRNLVRQQGAKVVELRDFLRTQ